MPIVTSTIAEDRAQRDGRRTIREVHTDHTGQPHYRDYWAEPAQDVAAGLAVAAAAITAGLESGELRSNADGIDADVLSPPDPPTFVHSTPEQLGTELRERFRVATGLRAARIAQWLLTRTDLQLRALFGGLTQTQVNQLKTRLTAKVTAWTNARNITGE